jgi:hypothetical protein
MPRPDVQARQYTPAQRTEAVAIALTAGDKEAARITGVPQRTVAYWKAHAGEQTVMKLLADSDLADGFRQVVHEGTAQLLAGVRDPQARLGDKARAVDVAVNAMRLLTNASTQNIATNITTNGYAMSEADARQLRQWLDRLESMPDDALADEMMPALISAGYVNSPSTSVNIDDDAVRADDHAD